MAKTDTVAAFAHELPFQDNTFDLVVSFNAVPVCLPTKGDWFGRTLGELVRVTKEGGVIRLSPILTKHGEIIEPWLIENSEKLGIQYEYDPDLSRIVIRKNARHSMPTRDELAAGVPAASI